MSTKSIVSFVQLQEAALNKSVLSRWKEHFRTMKHELLLELLVHEHENDFPMRRSGIRVEELKHQAMIEILDERAQTEFLRSFLKEIEDTPSRNDMQ